MSEILKDKDFGYIMGLSSNFASLNQHQREIMLKYNIKDFTIIPATISKINKCL